ncbi:oligopeptide transporter 1-like [Typha angustifolia]|uniref:oligopeptide transporter 1-like n=1 Tax=Typha angustifolia TaxID=59011 RepID=UPI003C2B7875
MAATLPTKAFRVPLTGWTFTLNPGPFNLKEHALITIFAGAGASGVYAINIIAIVKAFYKRKLHPVAAMLLAQTTQLLGYGWAGLFRKYLVDSPYMWWPANLVQVSLFRALHEEEKRPKGRLSRLQFFLISLISSFAYYIIPSYFFPSITALSFVCWIWKDSITAHQLGSGLKGLGIGSFGLDWNTVVSFLGSPLATPAFAIFNTMAGFILTMYIIVPISYWTNTYNAKRFPLFSSHVFDSSGHPYNTTRVLDDKTFSLNFQEYDAYSKINLSVVFVYTYGFGFAALMATISHVALFHGRTIWQMWSRTTAKANKKFGDVHTRLMKKNYRVVPQWWFHLMLIVVLALSFYTCEGFGKQLQLPWWGLLLACAMAFIFTLPVGVIYATTNQQPGLNIITEMVIGYIYPGKPLANVVFKTYGYISMAQALGFLGDFKLGHYMKIPPRAMFWAQLVGTIVASTVHFMTAWWLLSTVESICDVNNLPPGSPWTCPGDDVFYNASIIWGVVGPLRMFGKLGLYSKLNYFFLLGLLSPIPVWLLARLYPDKEWIKLISMPILLGGASGLLPARSVNFIMWGIVGILFNYFIYNRYKKWWLRHNYVLAAALDAGIAFMGVLTFLALGYFNIYGMDWWGGLEDDHCPLASCPTAPGVLIPGCPAVQ